MKVTFLGHCANQTATNEAVAFIVDCGSTSILVETGPGIVRQLLRAGRYCTEFDHVIVTHCHGDHTLGYPYFIWNHFYEGLEGRKGPEKIHVYSNDDVIEGLRNTLEFCYITSMYPFKPEYHVVSKQNRDEFKMNDVLIQTLPVDHTAPTFGIRIDYKDKSLAYSSDTIYHEGFVELAKGVDLLIHEGFVTKDHLDLSRKVKHATADDAGRCANVADAKKLAMVHLFPPYLSKVDELVSEAKDQFDKDVFVPEELMVVDI